MNFLNVAEYVMDFHIKIRKMIVVTHLFFKSCQKLKNKNIHEGKIKLMRKN